MLSAEVIKSSGISKADTEFAKDQEQVKNQKQRLYGLFTT